MIESLNNEKIKYYTKLNDKKYRKSEKLFIAAGEHLVTEALKKNIVKEILLLNGEENVYGDVTYVTSDILKKVSDLTNYPKVLAICYIKDDLKIEGNVVALDNIKDPGNLGTIIRSAVAFNYDTILLSEECVDVYNSKVVRATEGMLFNVNIVTCDLFSTLLKLKERTGLTDDLKNKIDVFFAVGRITENQYNILMDIPTEEVTEETETVN